MYFPCQPEERSRVEVSKVSTTGTVHALHDPEFAYDGLWEHEGKAEGVPYRLTKPPMAAFLRTRTLGETAGFAKVHVATTDDTILGYTAVGVGGGEILPVVQLAMKKVLPYTDIADWVIVHPTLSEGLVALFGAASK